MTQSCGFITIATGKEQYFELAVNLLRSYRHFSEKPLPFAIIADRENEYTAEFDDVRIFRNATCSYLDKLEMYDYLPYDINIFIDADCLAYGDLNTLFDRFKDTDDFCCFGRVLPLDDKTGWFEYENLGELKSRVDYVVGLHGGIYYMRKTEVTHSIFADAKMFAENYADYKFKGKFATPGDEPLVALAMAVNQCHTITHDKSAIVCYWEHENGIRMNVRKGEAYVESLKLNTDIVHWGTRFTKTPLYKKQIAALNIIDRGGSNLTLVLSNVKYSFLKAADRIRHFSKRVINKLCRMLHI